ncbi:outer membrane protein [Hansschlegelia quercus]|uniref:Porin family protein n=1 Tax=Hansschlegelia quercus TaxID=2528245 RepID=A0A4Q9GJN6_9HYPH|nr:outer membrane protein [Hansschlegelia quercus]TBN54328.1 porin family protein [Hansschlegelia quercus]
MTNKLLAGVASAAILTFSTAAFAADLPAYEPAPAAVAPLASFTWTGAYLGAHAGYAWGDTNIGRVKPKGALVGAFAGYNYQLDGSPVVIGIDTDFNYADIDDSAGGVKVRDKWNGATRARVGYAFDRFLAYGAGGIAYADRKVRVGGVGTDTKWDAGWTVGGGAEYAATDNVFVRAEYRYTDYGHRNFEGVSHVSDTEHRVMAGVGYKFGW